jgi:osmotically-inducible protein OsmY
MARRYEDRYGRGGYRRDRDYADDRGYVDRAGDEVRSWFGDEDAQRRRTMDEYRDREQERRHGSDWDRSNRNRSDWNRSESTRSDWNRSDWNRRPENWRGTSQQQGTGYQGAGNAWSNWDRDRDQERWRDRDVRDYGYSRDYESIRRDEDRYGARDYRPSSTWSVDQGRTEFGQQHWGRGPKGYQRSDNRILEDVCDRLMYSDVDAGDIEVKVENGEVTLSGSVRDRWDKRRAEDVAEEVSGVRDVHNNIRVHRESRGIGQSDTSASEQPGTVLGVNPTEGSNISNARPKART